MKGFSIGFPKTLFEDGRDHLIYLGIKGDCNIKKEKAESHFFKNNLYSTFYADGTHDDKIEKILAEHDDHLLQMSRYLYSYFFDEGYKEKLGLTETVKANLIEFMKIGYKRSYPFLKSLKDKVDKAFPNESEKQKKNFVIHLFCQFGEGQHKGIPSVDDVLSKKGTIIFIIRSNKKRFIMSDNLFYQLQQDGLANKDNEFCFPLNEKIFILKTAHLSGKQYKIQELYDKDIDTIRYINERTVVTAHSKLAGSNKLLLQSLCRGASWKTR